jgi:hypothetical protein
MVFHSPLNAFSFDISLIEIGQEIKLLEHLKKNWITLYIKNLEFKFYYMTYIDIDFDK